MTYARWVKLLDGCWDGWGWVIFSSMLRNALDDQTGIDHG